MDRSIEILKILRSGMETMVSGEPTMQISYTRIFNFSERRVSLRMELSGEDAVPVPMGRVDVVERSSNNGQSSCNCTLTELQTGQQQRLVLRLKDAGQREKECEKVFNFFRSILSISEKKPLDGGFSSTRGAHGNTSE
jgi:hypothetical protein